MSDIFHYFPQLTDIQKSQIESLVPIYKEWNRKINVLSRKENTELWLINHILHSLSIAKFISFKNDAYVMDLGTGGGFPGIPLSIAFPETQFLLLDSIGKKINVVQNVIKDLGLTNVVAEHKRAESVSGNFDFVVSRAVAPLAELHLWIKDKIKKESVHDIKNGLICLKGGDLSEELLLYGNKVKSVSISDFFVEDFFETKKIIYLPI